MPEKISQIYLDNLQSEAESKGKQIVVSALISKEGKIFVQKRSAGRKIFPNGWDVVGGHLEKGERIAEALRREIAEETSWQLKSIDRHILSFDWEAGGEEKSEFAFLVTVVGDLENPILEADKHSHFYWLAEAEIDILADRKNDMYIYNLVKKAFELL